MMACALDENGRLAGAVTFDNLDEVRRVGEALIGAAEAQTIEIDCSGLNEASSVAVALLVAWRRAAGASGKSIVFRGTSRALRDIASFSGVNGILALEA